MREVVRIKIAGYINLQERRQGYRRCPVKRIKTHSAQAIFPCQGGVCQPRSALHLQVDRQAIASADHDPCQADTAPGAERPEQPGTKNIL